MREDPRRQADGTHEGLVVPRGQADDEPLGFFGGDAREMFGKKLEVSVVAEALTLFRLANAFIAKARNSVFISFAVVLSIVITPLRNCWLLQYCCGAWLGDVRTLERSRDPRPLALARRYHPRMRGHKTTLA